MGSEKPAMSDLSLNDADRAAAEECKFTGEEALAFKGVYNHYDQNFGNGDGKCTIKLVKSMVRALGINMAKPDEEKLAEMLNDCDRDKDGSTQFPEFLLLISAMQKCNFCGMNDAAADRVKKDKEQKERRKAANQRRNSELAAHRQSMLYMTNQQEMFDTLNAHAKTLGFDDADHDDDDDNPSGLKE